MSEGAADKETAAGLMAARPQAIGGVARPTVLDAAEQAWLQPRLEAEQRELVRVAYGRHSLRTSRADPFQRLSIHVLATGPASYQAEACDWKSEGSSERLRWEGLWTKIQSPA